MILTAAMGGGDLDQRVEYYEPYENHIDQILARSIERELIFEAADTDKEIFSFLEKHESELDNYVYLPINSAKKDAIIVLDKKTAKPIATINTNPWVLSKK